MAYDSTNVVQIYAGGKNGRSVYFYSTTDANTTVDDASYFDNGVSRHNMKVGDLMWVSVLDSVSAPTSVTTCTMHNVASVSGNAATVSAAIAGSTVTAVNNTATAAPVSTDDTTPGGYTEGSIWVDVTNDEAWINVDKTNSAAKWYNIGNEIVLSYPAVALASAATTLRFIAPFIGRVTAVRCILNGTITGTAKAVRLVLSGVTCTSGSLSLTKSSATGAKFAATPTTGNKMVTAGMSIFLQTASTALGGSKTGNFFIVCRRQNVS